MMLNPVGSVKEWHIDFLLLEEFHISSDFVSWFVGKCFPQVEGEQDVQFQSAYFSQSDGLLGESDLVLVAMIKGEKHGILIEDKIYARAQPDQALRYRQRGQRGLKQKRWKKFITCIIAPREYLEGLPKHEKYDVRICHEDIADWFLHLSDDKRAVYRANLILLAIEKKKRLGSSFNSKQEKQFQSHYVKFLKSRHENLPAPVFDGAWVSFKLGILTHKNIKVYLHHKLTQGMIELEFKCSRIDHEILMNEYAHLQKSCWKFIRHSKYLGLRRSCARIYPNNGFVQQKEPLACALWDAQLMLADFKLS